MKSLDLDSVTRGIESLRQMAESLEVTWHNKSVVGYSPAGKDVGNGIVGSVTRKRLVKAQRILCMLQLQ
jgi:hypothetical protein